MPQYIMGFSREAASMWGLFNVSCESPRLTPGIHRSKERLRLTVSSADVCRVLTKQERVLRLSFCEGVLRQLQTQA